MKSIKNALEGQNTQSLYTHTHTQVISENKTLTILKSGQSGRSMVEMLGVLAIVGVISIGGIAGYNYAMNRSRTNEILDGANKRAYTIETQISLGLPLNLSEFNGYNEVSGGTFQPTVQRRTGGFGIQVDGVMKPVCENLIRMMGPNTQLRMITTTENADVALTAENCGENNNLYLVYNMDMSATGSNSTSGGEGGNEEPEPPAGPSCPSGSGENPSEYTGGSFTVTEGSDTITCYCAANESYKDGACSAVPASCNDHTTNQCGLGYYCQFSPDGDDDTKGGNPNGVCTKITGGTDIITSTKTYLKGPETDWWSAYSWCKGNDMNLVKGTIAGKTLNSYYQNANGNGPLYSLFGEEIYFWTGEDINYEYYEPDIVYSSAWVAVALPDYEFVGVNNRNATFYALCE